MKKSDRLNESSGISICSASKSYGKHKVVSDISLDIEQGIIYGLLGPSGCGKSTIVKMIAGILKPDSGSISIMERRMPDFEVMGQIGYMAQSAALYPTLSAFENMEFFGSLYKGKKVELRKRIHEIAELVNLTNDLKKPVEAFSGGMKQRLSLAITLLPNPKVLILDEPTVGIDPLLRQSIWKQLRTLRDQGVTIVITTHVMDEVSRCDKLAMMRDGQILISATSKEIQTAAATDNIEDAFIYFSKHNEEVGESYEN